MPQASTGWLPGVDLAATGVPNQAVVLQMSTNLPDWFAVATNHFSPNGTWLFKDAAGSGQKFFRLQLP